jgi:hypothetical protein
VEGGMGFIFLFIIIYKKFGFFLKTLEREGGHGFIYILFYFIFLLLQGRRGHGFYFFIFLKKNWRRKMEC